MFSFPLTQAARNCAAFGEIDPKVIRSFIVYGSRENFRIVLNRSNSKVGMKQSEVEAALGLKVDFEVPSDRAVPLAVNRGKPVVIADESADVSRALRQMAKRVVSKPKAEAGKNRLFAFSRS